MPRWGTTTQQGLTMVRVREKRELTSGVHTSVVGEREGNEVRWRNPKGKTYSC
jgi:hypothetical protein